MLQDLYKPLIIEKRPTMKGRLCYLSLLGIYFSQKRQYGQLLDKISSQKKREIWYSMEILTNWEMQQGSKLSVSILSLLSCWVQMLSHIQMHAMSITLPFLPPIPYNIHCLSFGFPDPYVFQSLMKNISLLVWYFCHYN